MPIHVAMGGHRFVIVHTAGKIKYMSAIKRFRGHGDHPKNQEIFGDPGMEIFANYETEKSTGPGRMPRTGSGHEPVEVNIGGKVDFDGSGSKNDFGP